MEPDEPLVHHGTLDGQAVEVRVASGGLVISGVGQAIVWPYSSVRVTHLQPARFVHQHEALEIAGSGVNPEGHEVAWIAVLPEPASLALLAIAGANLLRRRPRARPCA